MKNFPWDALLEHDTLLLAEATAKQVKFVVYLTELRVWIFILGLHLFGQQCSWTGMSSTRAMCAKRDRAICEAYRVDTLAPARRSGTRQWAPPRF